MKHILNCAVSAVFSSGLRVSHSVRSVWRDCDMSTATTKAISAVCAI
jgi:hypothetical protein